MNNAELQEKESASIEDAEAAVRETKLPKSIKNKNKKYYWHTGFPGGIKEIDYKTLMQKDSPKALKIAVKGMLAKNSLGRKQINRLFAYKDENHKQQAQKPEVYVVKGATR